MSSTQITAGLMRALRDGNQEAGRELVNLFYPELRRLAAAQMKNERALHTWQPSALVHELYLELLKTKGLQTRDYGDSERQAFFALAGQIMKRLLIHHARPLYRRVERVRIGDSAERGESTAALYEVEDALSRLGSIDPKLRAVVEMKVFEGLTGDQIAEQLGCSRRTVGSCWMFARRWLQKEWAGAEGVAS
jgi:RNA polymerase sigma factor (TIGR02999 family)